MADPTCGYVCVENTTNQYLETCDLNVPCVCRNQGYINALYDCISSVCSAADIQTWNEIAAANCEANGATFPTFSVSLPGSTVAITSIASSTTISTAVVVAASTITTAGSAAPTNFGGAPVTSSSTLSPAAPSEFAPLPTSQSTSNSGLSTGATVGIVLGAVAMVLLALIAGLLLWRRRRTLSEASHQRGAPHNGGELAIGPQGDFDKEGKSTTTNTIVTGVETAMGLPKESAMLNSHYMRPNSASELPVKPKTVTIDSPQPGSPTPAYSKTEGSMPS